MPVLISCSVQPDSSSYAENGLSLELPRNWEVFQDYQGAEQYRSVSITTHVGSMVTLDIYNNTDASKPTGLRYYLGKYVELALPEELGEVAQIDYGETYKGETEGMFVNIFLPAPYDLEFLIETYRKQTQDQTVYITFNTPAKLANEIQPHTDAFLKGVKLNEARSD